MIKLINLPRINDNRGNLSVIEKDSQIPFEIQRVYWIYDVPGGEFRGSHALELTDEFIVAISGSFDVILHDGKKRKKFSLNRSYYGLYIPKLTWRKIQNFSTNALALIVASNEFDEKEYIRDFKLFLNKKEL